MIKSPAETARLFRELKAFFEGDYPKDQATCAYFVAEITALQAGATAKPGPAPSRRFTISIGGQGSWEVVGALAAYTEVVELYDQNPANGRALQYKSFTVQLSQGGGQWTKRLTDSNGNEVIITVQREALGADQYVKRGRPAKEKQAEETKTGTLIATRGARSRPQ